MKRKLLIILSLFWCSLGFCQTATNRIVNMATIYSANSPISSSSLIGTSSNVFAGGFIAAGTNAQAGIPVGAHFLESSNAGNPVLVLWNLDPTGLQGFFTKNQAGTDSAFIGSRNGGTNIQLHAFLNATSYIEFSLQGGSGANQIFIHPTVTTNTLKFVAGAISSTNYQANGTPGATAWSTNVGIGVTNVLVFTNGLFMGQFTTP